MRQPDYMSGKGHWILYMGEKFFSEARKSVPQLPQQTSRSRCEKKLVRIPAPFHHRFHACESRDCLLREALKLRNMGVITFAEEREGKVLG
jgi:hypothetical protein